MPMIRHGLVATFGGFKMLVFVLSEIERGANSSVSHFAARGSEVLLQRERERGKYPKFPEKPNTQKPTPKQDLTQNKRGAPQNQKKSTATQALRDVPRRRGTSIQFICGALCAVPAAPRPSYYTHRYLSFFLPSVTYSPPSFSVGCWLLAT